MKILNIKFINRFNKKIINIHPSLLPKYKGLNTFKRVLYNNEKLTGCTVHYVNKKLDAGKIILKKKVFIESSDDEKKLKAKVQAKEYRAYSESIINIFR
jgi:folate-dependent phosphoribosylglycinamide formyltransferase PurN